MFGLTEGGNEGGKKKTKKFQQKLHQVAVSFGTPSSKSGKTKGGEGGEKNKNNCRVGEQRLLENGEGSRRGGKDDKFGMVLMRGGNAVRPTAGMAFNDEVRALEYEGAREG